MAKTIYIGVDGVARKVKKIYIGVDGVARKVKKIYIGVNGIARLCFSGGEVSYVGQVATISLSVSQHNPVNAGSSYLLFLPNNNSATTAMAYNTSLTASAVSKSGLWLFGVVPVPNSSAIVAGGQTGTNISTSSAEVSAYSPSLAISYLPNLPKKTTMCCGGKVGNYGIVAGGEDSSGNYLSSVYSFDAALTRATISSLSVARRDSLALNAGDCVLIAGGYNGSSWVSVVDVINSALTYLTPTSLSFTGDTQFNGVASVGKYGLIAGLGKTTNINAFDSALTRVTPTPLSYPCGTKNCGTSLEDAAVFATHQTGIADLNCYDDALVRTNIAMQHTEHMVAGTIANHAIFVPISYGVQQAEVYTT